MILYTWYFSRAAPFFGTAGSNDRLWKSRVTTLPSTSTAVNHAPAQLEFVFIWFLKHISSIFVDLRQPETELGGKHFLYI
jgi:hypothetical protein